MRKAVQRRFLDFLSTKLGVAILVIGCFTMLSSALILFSPLGYISNTPWCKSCSTLALSENLAEKSLERRLCIEPFDVVYTWVNGSDPVHLETVREYKRVFMDEHNIPHNLSEGGGIHRFRDNEELRYSLRSLYQYAPWIPKVYIVTNGQVPYWLNTQYHRVQIITHDQIFEDKSHLPTFSSPAIESNLHNIPGISKRFLYFNDDVMLGNSIWPDDFYTHSRGQRIFESWNVPDCAPGCPDTWISDGYCDANCNNADCNFDGGDCVNRTSSSISVGSTGGYGPRAVCALGCANSWIGDKVCDRACKTAECGFDGGDCGEEMTRQLVGYTPVNGSVLEVEGNLTSFYFDLNEVFESEEISSAFRSDFDGIHSVVLRRPENLVTVVLSKFPSDLTNAVDIQFGFEGNVSTLSFNLSWLPFHPEEDGIRMISHENLEEGIDLTEEEMDGMPGRHLMGVGEVDELYEEWERAVEVEGVPLDDLDPRRSIGKDFVLLDEMNEDDLVKAEYIQRHKLKQMRHLLDEKVSQIVSRKINRLRSNGTIVWPWEMTHISSDPMRRKLLDEFADSIRFVASLYNTHFGRIQRKVIAHMPHLIDKDIFKEMRNRWGDLFDETSSHKFRHKNDMQFAFSYMYYIVQASEEFDLDRMFRAEIDQNRDGYVSSDELEEVSRLYSPAMIDSLKRHLFRCADTEKMVVTKKFIKECPDAVEALRKMSTQKHKYSYELTDTKDVIFYMVGNNVTKVESRLDEILEERRKFVCLNDNMEDPSDELIQVLHRFFERYYPIPSPFELPRGQRNPSLDIYELNRILEQQKPSDNSMAYNILAVIVVIGGLWLVFNLRGKKRKRFVRQ